MKDLTEIFNKISIHLDKEKLLASLMNDYEKSHAPYIVSFMNAHALNMCVTNPAFYNNLIASDILLRDGSGMDIACRILGIPPGLNLNGTDFIPLLLEKFKQKSIVLYGTDEQTVAEAANILKNKDFNCIYAADGFHSNEYYIERLIERPQADIVILGMGMPRQEELSIVLKNTIARPMMIVNGGAIIDFIGNKVPRSPAWMQRYGVEWVYRLLKEPRRLWRRYVVGNIMFIYRVIIYKYFVLR